VDEEYGITRREVRAMTEEQAACRAVQDELANRIQALTAELEASGSAYVSVGPHERLAYAIDRIDAELARNR
jgi:hypothetical protein